MGTRATRALLVVSILAVVAAGCAGSRPVKVPGSRDVPEIRKTQPAGREEAKGDGEAFNALETKMDEYQDLMAACDRLARTEENTKLRDSCALRLRTLRQELLDLTNLLQAKPE